MKDDKTITFVLVDDHPVVRDGMEAMLLSEEGFESLGTAADGEEALSIVKETKPDLVLTDVRMPRGDGFMLLGALRKKFPQVKVILLAGSPIAAERDEALAQGASGYLSKAVDLEMLVSAIRKVMSGEEPFVEDVHDEPPSLLSARERDVLWQFSLGKTREEVAKALGLGPETVKTHTRIIMKKLNVPNTLSAVTAAIRMGVIRP